MTDYRQLKFYADFYNDPQVQARKIRQAEQFISQVQAYLRSGQKVLDVGCGTGATAVALHRFYPASQVFGLDLSPLAVALAKKNGVVAKKGDVEQPWPFPNGHFDVVFGLQIIEHLLNPDHFLQQAKRILKPGGMVMLATPNLAAWFNRLLLLLGFQPFFLEASTKDKTVGLSFTRRLTPHRNPVGHVRVFTLPALCDLLRLHSFTILSTTGIRVDYLPVFLEPANAFFSLIPSLATEFTVVASKNP